MSGLESIQPALRDELRQVRQLALLHPLLDEVGIHPVEAQNDELLREPAVLMGQPARQRDARHEQRENESLQLVSSGTIDYTVRFMRVLGLDVGERRIGVAISDATRTLARPLGVLTLEQSNAEAALRLVVDEVARLSDEEDGIQAIVVGLPRRLDGSPTDMTPRVQAFAGALQARTGLPVHLQDERLSSVEAESRLAIRERDWRARKRKLDAAAAAIILQDYLDSSG